MTREDAGGADLERRARESILANAKLGIHAPEFGADKTWLNVSRPLSLHADLAGKVVLIDFWTFCCINCMHVLPTLAALEERFADRPFTVVGCHSAKFANEGDVDQIRQAVLRHDIAHPVVVDRDFEIWRSYAVRAWPTLMLVSPDGRLLAQIAGEPAPEVLEAMVGQALEVYAAEGKLDPRPLPLRREDARELPRELAYPGKIVIDPAGERLLIADTGHHRILETTIEGAFLRAFGSGEPGLADGPPDRARFRAPQGMAFHEGALLVADTENHAVRRVDIATGEVTTLAGTGAQGHAREGRFAGREATLNSPWDLVVRDHEALIAMAGSHQIWRLDLRTNEIGPLAGDGSERKADGPFEHAAFAQPSGLVLVGDTLYVADSESSSIRAVNLVERTVTTLAGGNDDPRDLFFFGDKDGRGYGRRFQHPLGIASHPPCLIVADSYNHKLKRVHPERGLARTLSGTGRPGTADGAKGEASFGEPGGVAVLRDRVFIADTNNHRIRIVDAVSGAADTLVLTGVPVPSDAAGAPDQRGST
jgi:thiol-disulfide isomerase/thioredoxin